MLRVGKVAAAVGVAGALLYALPMYARQDARAAIEASNKQFVAAFGKGDAAALAAMYSATAIAYPPNSEPVSGRAAIQKIWQGAMGMGVKAVTLTTSEVETHGDTAYEVGGYTMLGEGGKHLDHGKYVVIWKREQGAWKLHRDIWNTSMPAAKQ
jgi:ketosteroid isomerase-like protein